MAWDDQVFKDAIERAAAAVGKSRTAVLLEAGIGKAWLSKAPAWGRQINMLDKLMGPLGWTPDDVTRVIWAAFGWSQTPHMVDGAAMEVDAPVGFRAATQAGAPIATIQAERLKVEISARGKIEIVVNVSEPANRAEGTSAPA